MRKSTYLVDAIRHPWAILEAYVPIVSAVIARILSGEPVSAGDRSRIEKRRAAFRRAHPDVVAYEDWDDEEPPPPPEPYARVSGSGYAGAVAVIGVYGVITQRGGFDFDTSEPLTSATSIANAVKLAAADQQVSGIVLDVDSPGGSVYGIAELSDAIYAAREAKPIAAVANSLMASAAYYAACQCDEVYSAPGAEVGSIGVYTMHANVAELLKQRGISVELISAGKYKTEANPYGPLGDEARAHIQAAVDQYYDAFVRAVARGRGTPLKAVREGMGQGRVLQAEQAKAENMIDGVATLNEVISKVGKRGRARSASALARAQREATIAELEG